MIRVVTVLYLNQKGSWGRSFYRFRHVIESQLEPGNKFYGQIEMRTDSNQVRHDFLKDCVPESDCSGEPTCDAQEVILRIC